MVDVKATTAFVDQQWEKSILKSISDYIAIPNMSPSFDPDVHKNGYQEKAVDLLVDWVKTQKVEGLSLEIVHEKNRTPLIFMVVPGHKTEETVLLYGHMDKQPPLTSTWEKGLEPYKAVLKGDRLYGRGGADDGYSTYAAITAIKNLQLQKVPHARMVILIEASEESGSVDLPFYINLKAKEIGIPGLVVCLDSGSGNYDQMWLTTSLRGLMVGTLRVDVLGEGVHSGKASGVVPSSFRIIRQLLDRVEDSKTGEVLVKELQCPIPDTYKKASKEVAKTLGHDIIKGTLPFVKGMNAISDDLSELVLGETWTPTVSYTGVEGFPTLIEAGNVLRPYSSIKLSVRLPPSVDAKPAREAFTKAILADAPYGAKVSFDVEKCGRGWCMPALQPWLEKSVENASQTYFKAPLRLMGEGGSIHFMAMLAERFPKTQFVVTGVLGPNSNAHGPNEFLDVPYTKKIICAVSSILADHYVATAAKKE